MKKNCESLFVEIRMEEKAEVSEVPQDMKVPRFEKDSSKDVGITFETEMCLIRHSKISGQECLGNK